MRSASNTKIQTFSRLVQARTSQPCHVQVYVMFILKPNFSYCLVLFIFHMFNKLYLGSHLFSPSVDIVTVTKHKAHSKAINQ